MKVNEIIQGDCLEVLKTLPSESVDCVVTSPPYNKGSADRKCHKSDSWTRANISYGDFRDDMPEKEYQEQQKEMLRECIRILKPNGSIFYNHKPRIINHRTLFPHEWLGEFIVRQMIIWDRKSGPVLEPIRFMPTVEYIFWITKEQKTPKFNSGAFQYKEVWQISPETANKHPAPFPESISDRCILATTTQGDLVLDPYLGSGTVAVSAKKLGRNYIGIELNPQYVAMAEKRISGVTTSMFNSLKVKGEDKIK